MVEGLPDHRTQGGEKMAKLPPESQTERQVHDFQLQFYFWAKLVI